MIRTYLRLVKQAPGMMIGVYTIPGLAVAVGLVDLFLFSILRFAGWFLPGLRAVSVGEKVAAALMIAGAVWYYLAIWVYGRLVRMGHRRRLRMATREATPPEGGTPRADFPFRRIGLILSGGGAKGAYQAGAMKAIHEFLSANDAANNVVAVAGTSIGSWNTTFWLANEVRPGGSGRSLHEEWWKTVHIKRIVRPTPNIPVVNNHIMRNTPWRYNFDELFMDHPALQRCLAADPPIHFYLTRTNVETARLAFDTNNGVVEEEKRKEHPVTHVDEARVVSSVDEYKQAVFASMDIPPLFPYMRIRRNDTLGFYEDGGVADNLPIRLGTAFDHCDLLFVLPLNATFAQQASERSILGRLMRVMTVRQGVLERNSLKLIYLFNELSAVRNSEPLLACILAPGLPLRIDTTQFWRQQEAGEAFDLMYEAMREYIRTFFTAELIEKVSGDPETRRQFLRQRPVEMAIVPPDWQPGQEFDIETRF